MTKVNEGKHAYKWTSCILVQSQAIDTICSQLTDLKCLKDKLVQMVQCALIQGASYFPVLVKVALLNKSNCWMNGGPE